MRISDWSSDVCSSDLKITHRAVNHEPFDQNRHGGEDFSPEHVLINREHLERTSAMLLELPELTRAIFVLRRVEGLKVKDVAARLGISVTSVERHMRVAEIGRASWRERVCQYV